MLLVGKQAFWNDVIGGTGPASGTRCVSFAGLGDDESPGGWRRDLVGSLHISSTYDPPLIVPGMMLYFNIRPIPAYERG